MAEPVRIRIRCDEELAEEWRDMVGSIDDDATFAEVLRVAVDEYHSNPERFELRYNNFGYPE